MCSTGSLDVAHDLEARFYFSLCILDQQILLISTFFVKLVPLYLHRLFEFSSTETKMKTFCLEQNQCQIFLLGCPCCQDIFMWHCWDSSHVCLYQSSPFMMDFLVSFSVLFSSENSKKLSFGMFRIVGRFLTHCDGFFSHSSPRRGISPLSFCCLIMTQGFAGLTPQYFGSPFPVSVSTAARSCLHQQGCRWNIPVAKVEADVKWH